MAEFKIEGDNKNFFTLVEVEGTDDEETASVASEKFKKLIRDNVLVVVDFHATWCGPCKAIGPKFKEMAKQFASVKFLKVDVDDFEGIASDNEINCMPTFKFFKNGEMVHTLSGANEDNLRAKIVELSK